MQEQPDAILKISDSKLHFPYGQFYLLHKKKNCRLIVNV